MKIDKAQSKNGAVISHILARAFHDDPVMNYVMPYSSLYSPYFKSLFDNQYCRHDESYLTREANGAMLWLPPGITHKDPGLSFILRFFLGTVKEGRLNRLRHVIALDKEMKAHKPTAPHYYLHALGILPEHQGKGLGSALMRSVLKKCDDRGITAYLENSKQKNLDFYRKHGFEVLDSHRLDTAGPTIWFMERKHA